MILPAEYDRPMIFQDNGVYVHPNLLCSNYTDVLVAEGHRFLHRMLYPWNDKGDLSRN